MRNRAYRPRRTPPGGVPVSPEDDPIGTLLEILVSFRERVAGVVSSTVADENGLVVASDDTGPRSQALAANGVLLRRAANSAFAYLELAEPEAVVVRGTGERAYVSRIGDTRFTLVVLVEADGQAEAAIEEAEELRNQLVEILTPYH